jgi:hypothetical protein
MPYTGGGACSNTDGVIAVITYDYNVPDIWNVSSMTTLNGMPVGSSEGAGPWHGSGLMIGVAGYSFPKGQSHPYPFTVVNRIKSIFPGAGNYLTTVTITCRGGSANIPVSDVVITNGWDMSSEGENVFAGPAVPAGFALKTITCDVAVFDAPGGSPVGDNRIKAGQTWFVNPTPAKDNKGKSWTELFAGGYGNGFVPTSCVH